MNKNVKVAKQLVKLAKSLVAYDDDSCGTVNMDGGTVKDLAQDIYKCLNSGGYDDFSFQLPSGAVFCMEAPHENESCTECAIVSNSNYDKPGLDAFWFYDMQDLPLIWQDDELDTCYSAAEKIFDLDINYRFNTSQKKYILFYLYKRYGKEYNKPFDSGSDSQILFGRHEWYVETVEIIECIEDHFDEYISFLNQRWHTHGVRCFKQAMRDMYKQYLSSPMKKYGLKENEYDDFKTACKLIAVWDIGFDASDYKSNKARAKQIYDCALDFISNYD